MKHMPVSKFTKQPKDSLRKPKLFISCNRGSEPGLVQSGGWIFLFSSERSLGRKYFLKRERLHRCRLIERDLAVKTTDVLVLSEKLVVQPRPHPAMDMTSVCIYSAPCSTGRLSSVTAFTCDTLFKEPLYGPHMYIGAKPSMDPSTRSLP